MIIQEQTKTRETITGTEIWCALNAIKDYRLVFRPNLGHYIAGRVRSVVKRPVVTALISTGLICQIDNLAGVYEITKEGKRYWSEPPIGLQISGLCDGCGRVAVLIKFEADQNFSCFCRTCAGVPEEQ